MRKVYRPLLHKFNRHGKSRGLCSNRGLYSLENQQKVEADNEKKPQEENGINRFASLNSRNFQTRENPFVGFCRGLRSARTIQKAEDVEKAFERASSMEELKTAFQAMESVFDPDDKRLGVACLRMGQVFETAGEHPQNILPYVQRALRILEKEEKGSLMVAMCLHLMGYVHYGLNKFNEGLIYLNRANRILESLEKEGNPYQIKPIAFAVQILLGDTKTALGRKEEALGNYTRSLKLKEEVLEPDHPQVAVSYRQVAEAFVGVLDFKGALPLCLKAFDLHTKHLGENSVEVAKDRRVLAFIYSGLGEHDKAMEQNEAAKRVLRNWGMDKELLLVELDSANVQILLGNYDEAINILRRIVQHTDKESDLRATVFLLMGRALCNLEKHEEAKKCCELAANILKKFEQSNPRTVAQAYTELAVLHESMNDFGVAISLYKKALEINERSDHDPHADADAKARLGWLLHLTGNVEEAISYLESAVELLKECFGPRYFGVGYIYNNLGAAYLELERPHMALKMYGMAREVMEVALGPQHMDTIDASQKLADVHVSMGSYGLAIGFQKQVVQELKNHGPSVNNELKEAKRRLADLKRQPRQPQEMLLEDDMLDQSASEELLEKKDVIENEIKDMLNNEFDKLKQCLADLQRQVGQPQEKPPENDIPDQNITGKLLNKKSLSENVIEDIDNIGGKRITKKSASENEIKDIDCVSKKLLTNLTEENSLEKEIEDEDSIRDKLLTNLTKLNK